MSLYFIENNSVAYGHLLAELSLQWQFMRNEKSNDHTAKTYQATL